MSWFHVLRYRAGVPLNRRRHTATLGRWDTPDTAEQVRAAQPEAELLEVLARQDQAAR